jgi:transposase
VSKRKTRWTRDFKLQALSRMDDAPTVTALASELGVGREMLYKWRRLYDAGGAEALQGIGRPLDAIRPVDEAFAPSVVMSSEQQRIEALQRKIGQQQLDLDFFRAALRQVREQRLQNGVPGETASTR